MSKAAPAGSVDGQQTGVRVLVVDDEPNITELVSMALRYEGFTVKTAATGRGALSAVSQFSPALVILDVMLPDIAAWRCCAGSTERGTRSRSSF